MLMFLIPLFLAILIIRSNATNVECTSDKYCETTLRKGSKCVEGFCDNPFQYGCLRSLQFPGYERKLRACNSEDSEDASSRGLCQPSGLLSGLEYKEIRLMSQNWESSFFEAWILQILLSEFLDVPVTIETGKSNVNVNFYDPRSRFQYGIANDFVGLERASQFDGDCSMAVRGDGDSYESCGHAILELWTGFSDDVRKLIAEKHAESLSSVGIIGEEKWFIPKYTAEKDPSLVSYHGLRGLENRKKLAERFLRPITWADYCNEVSNDSCTSGFGAAQRPPKSVDEGRRFFVEGLYTGHFRKTKDNDCDVSPTTCTGHFVDYPCGWKRFFLQQSHHLGIGLKSDGNEEESGGYSYGEMIDIWHAANWTKSDIIGMWWRPEALYQQFRGTDFEFHEVNLPNPNAGCVNNRIGREAMCGGDGDGGMVDIFGSPEGTCDIPPISLNKLLSTGLYDLVNSEISEAKQSPVHDVLNRFTVDTYELEEIFENWLLHKSVDKYGYNSREAVCQWFGQNFEKLEKRLMLRTFPRQLEERNNSAGVIVAIIFGSIAVSTTLLATVITYNQRKKSVFRYAQVEFVFFLLFGLLLVSISAIVTALPPSNDSCIASVWLTYIGYTFEIGPLVVKIAAINKIMQEAQKMKRIQLSKKFLYGVVAVLVGFTITYMILWTQLDPPQNEGDFELTENETADGRTIVTVARSCRSGARGWFIVAGGIHTTFLLGGSILAFMTRKLKNDINETSTIAFLVYWNFVCVLLRMILFLLEDSIDATLRNVTLSLILSIDVFAAILIYFVPKFLEINHDRSHSERLHSHYVTEIRTRVSNQRRQSASDTRNIKRGSILSESTNEVNVVGLFHFSGRTENSADILPSDQSGIHQVDVKETKNENGEESDKEDDDSSDDESSDDPSVEREPEHEIVFVTDSMDESNSEESTRDC